MTFEQLQQDRQEVEKKPIVELHVHYDKQGVLFLCRREDSDKWEEVPKSYNEELMEQAEKKIKKTKTHPLLVMGAVAITLFTIYMNFVTL